MYARLFASLAVAAVLLTGCAQPSVQQPLPQPQKAAADEELARTIFGDRLVSVGRKSGEPSSLVVTLNKGKAVNSEPFKLLSAMALVPSTSGVYELTVEQPAPRNEKRWSEYTWDARKGRVTWSEHEFGGSVGTGFFKGQLTKVDSDKLETLASLGKAPKWEYWAGK